MLKEHMKFLHEALAYAPFRRIWRESLDGLQELLYKDVLLKQNFTTLGAARFKQDFSAIQSVIHSVVRSDHSASALSMGKLGEAVMLLNLPLDPEEGNISLKQVYDEVFAANQQAVDILNTLGMSHLTGDDAKRILLRRVEANDD